MLGSSRGPFRRSLQFLRKNRGSKIVSVCRSSPAKCMSSVSSSQLCYLSNWGFLFIVKLLGLNNVQFYIFIYTLCVSLLDLRRGNWISGNEILFSVKVKWFRVYIQHYRFKQCMSKIKVLTSILSFDYKHMVGALRLTPPVGITRLNSPYFQEMILNSLVFTPRFPFKFNFQRIQKDVE